MADPSDIVASESKKKWWQRPENWFTWGGLALVGYGILRGLDVLLPLLNRVLENLLYTSVLAGGVAIVAWLLVNKDIHKLVWYGYKSAMRWITRRFVEIDPIAIMQTFVGTLEANLQQISKSIADLKGQARKLEAKIKMTTEKQENAMNMALQAKQKGETMRKDLTLQVRKAKRAEQSNLTYQGLLNRIRRHIAVMEKVKEASELMVADIKDTVEEETEKRQMIQASYKAMSASRRILSEGKDREMFDMAMETVTNDYYNKLGEIEQFMDDSQHFINTMDLENGVYEEEALTKLEEWEKRSKNLLEGGSGKTRFRVEHPTFDTEDTLEEEAEGKKRQQSFADLFESLDK
jgi:hypothetical protein